MQQPEQTGSNDPVLAVPAEEIHHILFTGKGSEYFGIWVVNLLLTILTLGIYSAWAKVRRMQYFYRNTLLAGASFDYHGNPVAILKGRLIAVAMLVVYNVAGKADPLLGLAVGAVIVCVLPRLLLKSLQFRLHNSSYRGLRFRFTGTLNDAYVVFLLLPLASLFTLYLLAPFCHQRIKRFQHNNSAFGQTQFSINAPIRAFYSIYLKVLGIIIVGGGVLAFVVFTALGNPFIPVNGRVNPQAFAIPTPGGFGNLRRGELRGPGSFQADLGLMRNLFGKDKGVAAEFKVEIFNLFNHANFNNPTVALPNALGTSLTDNQIQPGIPFTRPSAGVFGIINAADPGRQFQFSLTLKLNQGFTK